jgi:hypothetical protein
MTKKEALKLIDNHKNKLINPTEMLSWVYLRVIILNLNDEVWKTAYNEALKILSA